MVMQRLRAMVGLGSASGSQDVAGRNGVLAVGSSLLGGALGTGSRWGANQREAKLLPTVPLIEQFLDEYDLKHFLDSDGDLTVRFETSSLYFFQYGANREVLQARMYLNRRYPVELRSSVALALDDWNRTKFFPKAYTVLPDDGMVGICGEQAHDFGTGVAREHMKYTVGVWIETLLRFSEWVEEHVWVPEP